MIKQRRTGLRPHRLPASGALCAAGRSARPGAITLCYGAMSYVIDVI